MFIFSRFIVTSEFQTIIHRSNFTYDILTISILNWIATSIFWNINNTFSFVCISIVSRITVYKNLFTLSRCHGKVCTITAVDTIFAILAFRTSHADRTICTINYYGRTVFTSYANGTIFTIYTVFTSCDFIGQCISICMFTSCSINILFNSQVFTSCKRYSFTIANCCSSCSCTISQVTFSIRRECVTTSDLICQTRQINLSFCTSYASACTIIVFQCYRFSCCIIFVAFSCTSSTLIYSFACTTRCSWTNMQFVRFQCISSRFQIGYVNSCIWSCSIS